MAVCSSETGFYGGGHGHFHHASPSGGVHGHFHHVSPPGGQSRAECHSTVHAPGTHSVSPESAMGYQQQSSRATGEYIYGSEVHAPFNPEYEVYRQGNVVRNNAADFAHFQSASADLRCQYGPCRSSASGNNAVPGSPSAAKRSSPESPAVGDPYNNVMVWLNDQACGGTVKRKRRITRTQRVAANTRERRRMVSLNSAFEVLRKQIPMLPYEKKPSRIQTLRLAMDYIALMTDILKTDEQKSGRSNSPKSA